MSSLPPDDLPEEQDTSNTYGFLESLGVLLIVVVLFIGFLYLIQALV